MKRFTVDWEKIVHDLIEVNSSRGKTELTVELSSEKAGKTGDYQRLLTSFPNRTEFMQEVSNKTNSFPTSEDLTGAATALLRLQDTYRLPTDKLAWGEIHGMAGSPELTGWCNDHQFSLTKLQWRHNCNPPPTHTQNVGEVYKFVFWQFWVSKFLFWQFLSFKVSK